MFEAVSTYLPCWLQFAADQKIYQRFSEQDKVEVVSGSKNMLYFHLDMSFAKYVKPHHKTIFGGRKYLAEDRQQLIFDYYSPEPCKQAYI